ncbi:UPF0323 family lipoprotein [Hydrogenimonas cancrithermarum]|uniref:UPF0323 lipoprotein n=1 Tax=Hydrogenimonas cancrithermarum TaxID=2993563 RepID=A0ABM8FJX2_9BACT|nr:UPF0323 family lipoprotein [Hydrogenimonas cancrithermarum]BDY12602.1 UPF0323 lipoprotein [Hydrogenimonas cancrithermarum]
MKHYIKKISTYAMVGSLGAVAMIAMSGCEQKPQEGGDAFTRASQKQGAFVVIDEVAPNQYKIAEEYPAKTTRVILRKLDGTEKILSKEELDALVAEEAKRIDRGESALTQPQMSGGGLSLGEALLASAAGAIIGSWIGSKLFNNPNYQKTRQRSYKSPSAYQRSVNSFNKAKQTRSSARSTRSTRSGFFGGGSGSSRSSFGSFGG